MKNKLLLLAFIAGGISAWGQNPVSRSAMTHDLAGFSSLTPKTAVARSLEKSMLCTDTVRYPDAKEQILGTSNYSYLDLYQATADAFSQTFLLSGSSLSISGVEIQAANNYSADPSGAATVTLRASIYSVDASNVPTTSLGSGTVTISLDTDFDLYYVNFAAPISVSSNYAVVIEPSNTDGIVSVLINDTAPGQSYDEDLSRLSSTYYPASNGNFVSISTVFAGAKDFEPLVGPIVSYTINTAFTVSQDPSCLGTPVTFTNTSTPATVLNSRMYSFQTFLDYFNVATSDSTFVYDMDNSVEVWNGTHTYTYPAAGSYNPTLIAIAGFWNTCVDFASNSVTVNPIPVAPTVTADGPLTFCAGDDVTLTSSIATGNTWSTGATTQSITVSSTGSYTTTVTTAGCTSPASAAQDVVVNALDDATFNYTSSTLCTGGANETPTVTTSGGTFSSTAGLTINPATGEIDMSTSTDGSYTVTYTTAGTCPNTSTASVTITAAPDATFTYAQPTYCSGDTDPAPVFGTGASAGTFSSTTGLSLNGTSGALDLSSSTPGTYTVTNTIAASGACPMASGIFDVTINQTPAAVVSGGGQLCGTGTIPVTVTLTGTGPWDFTYSDGTTSTPVTGQVTGTYTIDATANGIYTVTTVNGDGCTATGTGAATVVFNANPVITMPTLADVCANASTVALTATPAGGTYTGTGVTGTSFDPATAGVGTQTITYAYTDGNGCSATGTASITVNAVPAVTLAAVDALCVYDDAVTLTGTPAGGTFSGTGVSGTSFDPEVAGTGLTTVTYNYSDANGCSASAQQDVTVDECLGLNELEGADLLIVPNPANDFITISFTNGDKAQVELRLVSGDGRLVAYRTIESSADFSEKMDVSTLSDGVYFVQLTAANGTVTKKVVVQ